MIIYFSISPKLFKVFSSCDSKSITFIVDSPTFSSKFLNKSTILNVGISFLRFDTSFIRDVILENPDPLKIILSIRFGINVLPSSFNLFNSEISILPFDKLVIRFKSFNLNSFKASLSPLKDIVDSPKTPLNVSPSNKGLQASEITLLKNISLSETIFSSLNFV